MTGRRSAPDSRRCSSTHPESRLDSAREREAPQEDVERGLRAYDGTGDAVEGDQESEEGLAGEGSCEGVGLRGPMRVAHLVKRVQQLGYRTPSTQRNLLLSLYRVLRDKNVFRKVGVGTYELTLPPRTRGNVGRPKRRSKTTTERGKAKASKRTAPQTPGPSKRTKRAKRLAARNAGPSVAAVDAKPEDTKPEKAVEVKEG